MLFDFLQWGQKMPSGHRTSPGRLAVAIGLVNMAIRTSSGSILERIPDDFDLSFPCFSVLIFAICYI